MHNLTDVKVGDKVACFYVLPNGEFSVVVYDVVRETPKRLVIKRGSSSEYQVEKTTGKILGYNEYVKQIGEVEEQKILEIRERDRIQRMKQQLIKALQERGVLSDDQVKRMYATMCE